MKTLVAYQSLVFRSAVRLYYARA